MKQLLFIFFSVFTITVYGQIDNAYKDFDFIAGEKTLFEDNFNYTDKEKPLSKWTLLGGKASLAEQEGEKCLSVDEYYTKLTPLLFGVKQLPDSFSIEYDTWLDNGYDGNPGIEIHLMNGDDLIVVTPNKHSMSVFYPVSQTESKDNPEEYFGENKFYDRWVHISIAVYKTSLKVYLDQYPMIAIADCKFKPKSVMVTGNTSGSMKILLKNFRVATGFPGKINFIKGKFITRAIKFDVNKAILKPESITVIKQVVKHLTDNPAVKVEVSGHTDSDGADEQNMILSQQRADAVKDQLVSMGIDAARLTAKGFGEKMPLDIETTPAAKANNRRVEFTVIK